MGPCAKQRVQAVVILKDHHKIIVGENVCTNPQRQCPRVPGEAYLKCYTVCGQLGHAEETAMRQLRMAGYTPADVQAINVYGHTGPCDHCRAMLDHIGLLVVTKFYPDHDLAPLSRTLQDAISTAYNLDAPSSHSKHCP